jgi:radical SAM superfamily enzyme YgiQ (UPF0313 family)
MSDVTVVNSIHSHEPRVPLGALYLTSFLETHGYAVDFRDYQVCDDDSVGRPEHFAHWLSGAAPILAISTLSSSLPLILASLSNTKLRDRVETVVLGGPGVSSLGHRILEHFPAVDIVASSEGEQTLLEIVRQLENGGSLAQVDGISYRNGAEIRQNPNRSRIRDLDDVPFPAYRHVNLGDYTDRTAFDRIPLAVLSARGCPYSCTFCDIPGIWDGGIEYRSVQNVLQELEQLKADFAIPRFHIADDTFVLNRRRVFEFCRQLKERGLDIPWSCLGRVDRMDENVLRELADANCDTIFYGIESGSDVVLERIKKGFTAGDALNVVRQTAQYMKPHVSFIWGFPFEELEDLYDTVIALLAMHRVGAEPHLNLIVPLPSAELNLTFGDARQSLQAWEIGWDWAMMENYEYGDELHELIRTYPDIFAPFYCLESPEFERKAALLESWGLGLGKPRAPSRTANDHPPDFHTNLEPETRLPRISDDVILRKVGGKHFILDSTDCLLYEPGPRSTELFHACRRGDSVRQVLTQLSEETGCSPEEAFRFVQQTLLKFAQRGFL